MLYIASRECTPPSPPRKRFYDSSTGKVYDHGWANITPQLLITLQKHWQGTVHVTATTHLRCLSIYLILTQTLCNFLYLLFIVSCIL